MLKSQLELLIGLLFIAARIHGLPNSSNEDAAVKGINATNNTTPTIDDIDKECSKENPLTEELAALMDEGEVPDDDSVRRLLFCIAKRSNAYSEDRGLYNFENFVKIYRFENETDGDTKRHYAVVLTKLCWDEFKQDKVTPDHMVYNVHKCVWNNGNSDGKNESNTIDKSIEDSNLQCMKQHPITYEQMKKLYSYDFPKEESFRKYLLCMAEGNDAYSADKGLYDLEKFLKIFTKDKISDEIAKKCVEKNKNEVRGDFLVYNVLKCVWYDMDETPEGEKVVATENKNTV